MEYGWLPAGIGSRRTLAGPRSGGDAMRSTRRLGGLSRSANQSHPAAQAPGSEETPAPPGAAEPELPAPALVIDALGRKCPIPIIWLAQRIGEVPVGAVVT